jgi:anti-anti-sigma factor
MITVYDDIACKVICPQGNLTAEIAEELRNVLLPLADGSHGIRFDLSRVEDMDTVCLNLLVVFGEYSAVRNPDRFLEITGANNDLANLFTMMRLDSLFKRI